MIKTILTVVFAGATGAVGYLGGSIYPAPPEVVNAISSNANELRTRLNLQKVDLAGLRDILPKDKLTQLEQQFKTTAIAAGEAIEVEKTTKEEELDNLAMSETEATPVAPVAPAAAAPGGAAKPAASGPFVATLDLCPRMKIENAPAANPEGRVTKYTPLVNIKGVKLALDPSRVGCLSSGYGTRSGRLHKGVDYHSETGGPIGAAGDGVILEMKYREDYGNMILIDHGKGVYTRYAHLASFAAGLSPGVTVHAGEQIGLMGNTAGYQVPIHLHYEVLLGDYKNPKASFGLTPTDPFTYPSAI
jgi:murein DD-endopeptidase MepM/ murein hydrolase activator NlpD